MSGSRPHRARRILLWIAAVIVLLPMALILLVLAAANTGFGRSFIENKTASLTGHQVTLRGLSGRFPDALRLAHLEVHDSQGAWLTLDGVVLDWSPTALLGRTASIARLSAARLSMPRLPISAPPAKPAPASTGTPSLPVSIDLHALTIDRADIGASIAGAPAALHLSGSARIVSLADATAKLAIERLDSPGTYHLDGHIDAASIRAGIDATEPPSGLAANLAKLPSLGALAAHATIDGPRAAERLAFTLAAGQLTATAHGTIDLVAHSAALDVEAAAPAMSPRPDVSWSSLALTAHIHGPFTRPEIAAHADLATLRGGGATIGRLTLDATGDRGVVDAHAILTGLTLPPPQPALFAAAPLDLTVHARLDSPALPIHAVLRHPLLSTEADIQAGGDLAARLHILLPDLAPFAAIGKVDMQGSTEATATLARHNGASDVAVDGTAHFTGGQAPLPTALGTTTFGATARLDGQDLTVTRAIVDGRTAHLDATGTDKDGSLAFAWHVALSDLAALTPQAAGRLDATGRADTAPGGITATADLKGDVGTRTVPRGPITATLRATGLPANPAGTVRADGMLAGARLHLDAELAKLATGDVHATLRHADWKSLAATADLLLAKGATLPSGTIDARMTRLADLAPLIGQPVGGSLSAKVAIATTGPTPNAKIDIEGTNLASGANSLGRLTLAGHVRDPAAHPDASLNLTAAGIAAGGITGQAQAALTGPQTALNLRTTANLAVQGTPATIAATARLDVPGHVVLLSALSADYKTEQLRLRAPAKITYAPATAIDRLFLTLGPPNATPATLDISGRIAPTLAVTAALRHVTPALARPFAPNLHAAGEITADARLSGSTAAPQGSIRLQAAGLRSTDGQFAFLPAGHATASLVLNGATAQLDAQAAAGPKLAATLSGTAPLQSAAPLNLRLTLANDLSLLDPILGATGQRAAGRLAADAAITGTAAAPAIHGSATLAAGEIQDFVQGLRLTNIAARLTAAGDTIRIDSFTAQAGPGQLAASGTIGVLQPGLPVALHLTADHARPLSSDLLTATLDADLTVHGQAATALQAAGKILIRHANINIPNALPPSVAVLHVRRPGDKPAPAIQPPALTTTLAIEIDAPSQIFVRGHGLDSELGGKLTIAGTTAAPQIAGGFDMRRGTISVAGTTLNFTHGEVGFDGTSVTNKIDPTLNFVADSTSGGVTATLTVGGYADAPTIKLSSTPDLPQDEVLSHLLFGTSVKDLSAIQIAEIASALAELTGVTGSGSDPIGAVRRGLGLDRLSVGGASGSGTGATIEAGRYVARGVYVGAKQATSGGGTAAEVQIDLTRHLKAKAQLATGGGTVQGATPDNDPGSTVGLSYQFEY